MAPRMFAPGRLHVHAPPLAARAVCGIDKPSRITALASTGRVGGLSGSGADAPAAPAGPAARPRRGSPRSSARAPISISAAPVWRIDSGSYGLPGPANLPARREAVRARPSAKRRRDADGLHTPGRTANHGGARARRGEGPRAERRTSCARGFVGARLRKTLVSNQRSGRPENGPRSYYRIISTMGVSPATPKRARERRAPMQGRAAGVDLRRLGNESAGSPPVRARRGAGLP